MNSIKWIKVFIENSSYTISSTSQLSIRMWLSPDDPDIPQSNGRGVWDEGEVHRLGFSAEVNPEIQHIPVNLLQTKSQPVIFSFCILLEFIRIWTPLQWSIGTPIRRQSMYRALAPLPHSLKLLVPLFPAPILTARWQTSLNYNEAAAHTYVLADLFRADPTYHLHSHSSLFQWLQVWKNSNKLSSHTKDLSFSGGGRVGFILRFLFSSLWCITSSRTSSAQG